MLTSSPGLLVNRLVLSLTVWSLLFGSIQNVPEEENTINDFSSTGKCKYWNTTILYSLNQINRSIFFNLNLTNETKTGCPFKNYIVKLRKVMNSRFCTYQRDYQKQTINGANPNKSVTFLNVDVGCYCFMVEPSASSVDDKELCKNEKISLYNECELRYTEHFYFGFPWDIDMNYTQISHSLKVTFSSASHLGFFRYFITLSAKSKEGPISQHPDYNNIQEVNNMDSALTSTFNKVKPGKYLISISFHERKRDETCLCNINSGLCQNCKICENSNPGFCQKCPPFTKEITVEMVPESRHFVIVIIVISCISTISIVIIITIICYKRRSISVVIVDKSSGSDAVFHIKDMYSQNVLLVHGADFEEHITVVDNLANILESHCICTVTVVPGPKAILQAIQNQYLWLQKTLDQADKVIIVLSSSFHQKYLSLIHPPQKNLLGDMVSQLLDYLIRIIPTEPFWQQKLVLCRFNYTPCNLTLPFLPIDHCCELPQSLEDLILKIHNVQVDHLKSKIQIPDSDIEDLETSVKNAQRYLEVKEIETFTSLRSYRSDSEGYSSLTSDV